MHPRRKAHGETDTTSETVLICRPFGKFHLMSVAQSRTAALTVIISPTVETQILLDGSALITRGQFYLFQNLLRHLIAVGSFDR